MPRISALAPKSRAAGNDELPIHSVDQASTKKVTVEMVMPTGSLLDYAGPTAPAGWLLCFGQTLNATLNPEYAALYAIIGTTYGGSGITSFNLPDLRGRVVAGQDDMGGTSANRLTGQAGGLDGDVMGAAGGTETHTLSAAEMPAHKHSIYMEFGATANGSFPPGDGNKQMQPSGTTAGTRVAVTSPVNNTGGGGAHNNVQPTIILNKIIKY